MKYLLSASFVLLGISLVAQVPLANLERDIETKSADAARAGIHFSADSRFAKAVRYDLYLKDTVVHFSRHKRNAIAVNGRIPGPTLEFTLGDTAMIYVHNVSRHPASIHWHGVFLPNRMDGVSWLTQKPIQPGTDYLYQFVVTQDGTYWYHSHYSLQEQVGLYGALIFKKQHEPLMPTIPVVLSDWSDLKPKEIERSLHAGTDWFSLQKHAVQSYSEAVKHRHLRTKLLNEWKRMKAMDVSDVYYDKVLANGTASSQYPQYKAGDTVRLRIVNGGSSSYFWLTWSGGKITVVANDGNDVQPVAVDRLIIAASETFDIVVTIPENMKYEIRATTEDRTKHASIWLGTGMEMFCADLPALDYFEGMKMMNSMMKMNGEMNPMGMKMTAQSMDMNEMMYPELNNSFRTLNYGMLRSIDPTNLRQAEWRELHFELTGNMNRYVWTLDNKTVSESDKILIRNGENIRIILYNNSMMRHPMHLHGHDFRLLNGQDDYAPLKNVVDIMPMETDTLEFAATESGDWFFHCHILYHMMSGMGRIFHYQDSTRNPEVPHPDHAYKMIKMDDRMWRPQAEVGVESNGSEGHLSISQTRWFVNTLWHLGYTTKHGFESETMIGRYLGKMQWLSAYVGYDYHYKVSRHNAKNWFGQVSDKNDRRVGVAGVAYTLPWLVMADLRIAMNGKVRALLSRDDIPVTPRLRWNWMFDTDKEYTMGVRYILTKYFSLSTHYDSDMGWGAGVSLTY